jgi:hypothetical protein
VKMFDIQNVISLLKLFSENDKKCESFMGKYKRSLSYE